MQLTKGMPSALVGAWGGDTLPPVPFAKEKSSRTQVHLLSTGYDCSFGMTYRKHWINSAPPS